jgi:hypothetical protein
MEFAQDQENEKCAEGPTMDSKAIDDDDDNNNNKLI